MIEIKKTTDATYDSHSRAFVHPTAAKYSVLKDNEVVAYIMSSDMKKTAFTTVDWVLTDAKTHKVIKYCRATNPKTTLTSMHNANARIRTSNRRYNTNNPMMFSEEAIAKEEAKANEKHVTAFEKAKAYAREYYS